MAAPSTSRTRAHGREGGHGRGRSGRGRGSIRVASKESDDEDADMDNDESCESDPDTMNDDEGSEGDADEEEATASESDENKQRCQNRKRERDSDKENLPASKKSKTPDVEPTDDAEEISFGPDDLWDPFEPENNSIDTGDALLLIWPDAKRWSAAIAKQDFDGTNFGSSIWSSTVQQEPSSRAG